MDKRELKSNPFDVLTQAAFEVARSALFFNSRYKNADCFNTQDIYDLEMYFKRVEEQFDILSSLSQEEVDALRNMSYCCKDNNVMRLNNLLFTEFSNMKTEYSESFPFISVEFEKFTLGEDSDEFKRRETLRGICDSDKEVTDKVLLNSSSEKVEELVKNYGVEDWELDYMISYLRR